MVDLLKTEREVLLKSDSLPDNLESILQNEELSEDNISKHKEAIKQMIGKVHEEEDKR